MSVILYSKDFLNLADLAAGNSSYLKIELNMARKLGLSTCAVWRTLYMAMKHFNQLGQLGDDGFFFYTQDDLEYYSTVKEHQQRAAIEKLEELGLLEKQIRAESFGQRKRYFRIIENKDVLERLCSSDERKTNSIKKESSDEETSDSHLKSSDTDVVFGLNNNISNNNISNNNSINTKVLITQSVNTEEKSDNIIKEIQEDKNMLFNLPEKKILNTTSLPNNHAAVKRYLAKINGKELLPLKEFTTTDWMLNFIIEYNKEFEPYVLPPMGPSFNCLVEPFSNLLKDIPLHNRISVFREFIQIVKQGNRLPYSWVGGFTLEQMYSGYNFKNVKAEFDRLSEYISLSIQENALLTKVNSKNSGIQYF